MENLLIDDSDNSNEENKFTPSVNAENIANDLAISCQSFSPLKLSLTFIRFSILAIVVSSSRNSLKSSNPNSSLSNEYASACIAHFKFIDKAEIIQEDYKEYKTKKKNTKIDKNVIKNSNEFMLNKKSPPAPRSTDHINVKSTKIKTAKRGHAIAGISEGSPSATTRSR